MSAGGRDTFAFAAQIRPARAAGFARCTFAAVECAFTTIGQTATVGILLLAGGGCTIIFLNSCAVIIVRIGWVCPSIAVFTITLTAFGIIDAIACCDAGMFF